MFATMRRKRRSAKMKNELGQSVDHFKRAATIAAHETSATVGPKVNAARDRVQPAAVKAKDAASSSWDSALATLTPLVAAATETVRHSGKETAKVSKKQAKANRKYAQKNANKLEKRANKAMGRKQGGSRTGKLVGLALVGAAIGAGTAYVMRRRKAAQWDEYDPSGPIDSTQQVSGADDAAFEPSDNTAPVDNTPPTGPVTETSPLVPGDTADQTSSAQHSPKVARMASGQNGTTKD